MPDGCPIRVPQEFVNDDMLKLLRWFVEEGREVLTGATLAEIETSKAVIELAAEAAGRVYPCVRAGDQVRVGQVIGYVSANGAPFRSVGMTGATGVMTSKESPQIIPTDTRFSSKALELIRANGLSPSSFAGRGLVRERDVQDFLHGRTKSTDAPPHFAIEGISLNHIAIPAAWNQASFGKIDPAFLSSLQKDPDEFAQLSSNEKCDVYRKNGAILGDHVSLGKGSILIAPHMVMGAHAQIGANSSVRCRETFVVGEFTSFREELSIRCGTVVLGENVFGGARVQIGGGGHGDPYSVLSVGDGTYIGDDVFINVCRPVLIGREVFVTQRSILVTHNVGHSILEGYENRFTPIVLEDYSQVGMNSTIYAGSRLGQGSILLSNSYLVSSVPAGKLAGGVPARVLREAKRNLSRKQQIELVEVMLRDFRDLLLRKGYEVSNLEEHSAPGFTLHHQGKRFRLVFSEISAIQADHQSSVDEYVVWTFEHWDSDSSGGQTVMDLLGKTISGPGGIFVESNREFLRKRGIRLEPGPWRYRGGLI